MTVFVAFGLYTEKGIQDALYIQRLLHRESAFFVKFTAQPDSYLYIINTDCQQRLKWGRGGMNNDLTPGWDRSGVF